MAEHEGSRLTSPRQEAATRFLLLSLGWVWRFRFLLVAIVAIAMVSTSYAVAGITNLGKPTNAVSSLNYFPLDGFHHIGAPLRSHSRAVLTFLGTQIPSDTGSAQERWPVIKALDQFGTLAGVRPVAHPCVFDQFVHKEFCYVPTFDWSHAVYRSRYVAFEHRDLASWNGHKIQLYQHLSPAERRLFYKYARSPYATPHVHDPDHVIASVPYQGFTNSTHVLPLIAAGGYVQTVSQMLVTGDFQNMQLLHPGTPTSEATYTFLSYDTIHHALVTGQDPPTTKLVEDVNAEANIITALICHADGKRPGNVCNRAVIKATLKHVTLSAWRVTRQWRTREPG